MVNENLPEPATCFVICPFGNERTSKEEARIFTEINDLNANVFRPVEAACAAQGRPVRIVDARQFNDAEQDTIRDKVIELIDAADVVMMIMTADKPNGFIEYGWAMGMWKTPIILRRFDYMPPTNINNNLSIEYHTDEIDGTTEKGAADLVEKLTARILGALQGPARKKPFAHYPPTMLSHGIVDILGRFRDVSPKEWSDTLHGAEREIIMASGTMLKPTEQTFFDAEGAPTDIESLLLEKALQGVEVTVIMQHPDNTSIDHLRRSSLKKGVEAVRQDQDRAFRIWSTQRREFDRIRRESNLTLAPDGFRIIQLHKRYLPFRLTMTDKKLYLTHRFYTQLFNSGLCLIAEPGPADHDTENPSVYRQIRDELQFLIDDNEGPSEENYQAWLASPVR